MTREVLLLMVLTGKGDEVMVSQSDGDKLTGMPMKDFLSSVVAPIFAVY